MKLRQFEPYTPLIGITNPADYQQIKHLEAVLDEHRPRGSKHRLHVGVTTDRHGMPPQNVEKLFQSILTLNCVHICGKEGDTRLDLVIKQAIEATGYLANAIQLNHVWPDAYNIARGVSETGRNLEVILQISDEAFAQVDNDPQKLVAKLEEYVGIGAVHHVLFDGSKGKGVPLKAERNLPFAFAIRRRWPKLGVGMAGGLGPKTTHLIEQAIRLIPDLSSDAASRLRPSGRECDPLDTWLTEEYLIKMCALLDQNQ